MGRNLSREETWFFSFIKPCCFRVHLLDMKLGLEETILIVDVEGDRLGDECDCYTCLGTTPAWILPDNHWT